MVFKANFEKFLTPQRGIKSEKMTENEIYRQLRFQRGTKKYQRTVFVTVIVIFLIFYIKSSRGRLPTGYIDNQRLTLPVFGWLF